MFYVYELRDGSQKPFYIGKGSGRRMFMHAQRAKRGIKSKVCSKIRALYLAGEKVHCVIVFETENENSAFAEEIRLINYYGRNNLTNQTNGGDGVKNLSAQGRAKIAASRRGKIANEATRNRQRLAKLGSHRSEATKAKISAFQKTLKKPWATSIALQNIYSGKATFKGRKWSSQHRQRFLTARIGHIVTMETRNKISKTKKENYAKLKNARKGDVLA